MGRPPTTPSKKEGRPKPNGWGLPIYMPNQLVLSLCDMKLVCSLYSAGRTWPKRDHTRVPHASTALRMGKGGPRRSKGGAFVVRFFHSGAHHGISGLEALTAEEPGFCQRLSSSPPHRCEADSLSLAPVLLGSFTGSMSNACNSATRSVSECEGGRLEHGNWLVPGRIGPESFVKSLWF